MSGASVSTTPQVGMLAGRSLYVPQKGRSQPSGRTQEFHGSHHAGEICLFFRMAGRVTGFLRSFFSFFLPNAIPAKRINLF
jgi:hypothetical protein